MKKTLKSVVKDRAKVAISNREIKTHIGGGLHPCTSALWCYLLSIQEYHETAGDLMEIGVFKGWSLFIPAAFCARGQKLAMVDVSREALEHARRFLESNSGTGLPDLVEVHGDSAKFDVIPKALAGREVRWAHIDGEHSYGALFSDLTLTTRHSGVDAIVCIDDVDYAEAPSLNDCLHDWLANNKDWRLMLRGFNKAYLVSTRSRIPWRRYLSFLPEVLETYYGESIMLCSQTRSCDSDYYALTNRPKPSLKYMSVNCYFETLAEFEGDDPRVLLS